MRGDWSKATVKLDYHINVDHHDYSVPYQRATDELWIRLAAAQNIGGTQVIPDLAKH